MPFFVYIVQCSDGSYYTGHTDNIEARVAEHSSGKYTGYTAMRLPIELVYLEQLNLREEAFWLERKIKGWSRAKKKALIEKNLDELKELSRGKQAPCPSTSSG